MTRPKSNHLIVVTCFMIQALGVGTSVSYGVFFNSLANEFGWSRGTVSGASSLAFILSGIFAIAIGRLNDVYGPRNLMRLSAVFLGSGVMLMSQVSEIWQLYLYYGIIFGIGLSGIDVIALTTTARWFSSSRGFMTGLVKVGSGAGQFSIPFLASILITCYGWRQAYLIIGGSVLLLLFAIATLLKRDPEDGSPPQPATSEIRISRMKVDGLNFRTKDAVRTVQLWLICAVNMLVVFCFLTILVHIVPHATDLGLSQAQAAGVLSTIGAVSMIGRFVTGIAIDRTGSKAIIVVCFLILIGALLWLQRADSVWMLYLFACIYGLAHGSFFTAISPMVAEIFGIAAHGALFGIIVFSGTVGGSIGPIIAGKLFDYTGSYDIAFRVITLLSVVSLTLMLFLKPISIPFPGAKS